MSYEMTLEKAGAKVLVFEEFGSYQGDWYAKVEYNGEIGWITGSYGSCSNCDAFESEFGRPTEKCPSHEYTHDNSHIGCADCTKKKAELDKRYADFGRVYLDTILSQEKQEEILVNQIKESRWYKDEFAEILKFVRDNA